MVVFNLNSGNADFPYILYTPGFAVYLATDNGGIDWQSGVASGAYMLESFEPGFRA